MSSGQEFLQNKVKTSLLLCANFGEGKTSVIITFPKIFYIGFRQGGLEVIRQTKNISYQKNLIRYEELCPKSDEELREMFQPDGRKGLIFKYLDEAKEMAKKGEVDTLAIDDFTDGVENVQKYIWTFRKKMGQGGMDDTQGMYGDLKIQLSNLFDRDMLTFRRFGNLIVSTHVMREAEQTIEGTKTRAGAVDKQSDLYPDIIGSFRREVQRKFENVIYMETKLSGQQRKFVAYTCKQIAFGTVILAKNSLGLPPVIENVTYESILNNNQPTVAK